MKAKGGSPDSVLNLQLHGDSAFAGQGIVAESLMLSQLPHYQCGTYRFFSLFSLLSVLLSFN